MGRYRADGSIESVNNPIHGSGRAVRDFGLYQGMITDIFYVDSKGHPDPKAENVQVAYEVMLAGGDRDGQYLMNVMMLEKSGGINNYSEEIHKRAVLLGFQDVANTARLLGYTLDKLDGEVVYIQFINGDVNYPVIVGFAKHLLNKESGATEEEGIRKQSKFNGITTKINKDGEFSWVKDNGAAVSELPSSLTSPIDGKPYNGEFSPTMSEAVKITLGNEFDFKFEYSTGLSVFIDGTNDEITQTTAVGSSVVFSGSKDSFAVTTKVGTSLAVVGTSDSIALTAKAGTKVTVTGSNDTVIIQSNFGDMLELSGPNGLQVTTPTGTSLSMKNATVELKSKMATLKLDASGLIALGNSQAELLDLITQAFTALSTQVAAGFGSPTSTVGQFVELAAKMNLLKGSL